MTRTTIGLLIVLLAGCPAAAGQEDEPEASSAPTERASVRRVEIAVLGRSSSQIELRLPGEVEGGQDAVLGAALGGFIERVNVEDGSEVEEGDVLIQVDAATHRSRAAQTRIEVEASERELQRSERLGDALPGAQLDAARTRHEAARAAYRAASVAASRSVIRAPFDGVVAEIDADPGEIAPPGAPLLRLVNLDAVKVIVSVSDRDVVALAAGMEASVSTDAQSGVFTGTISHINPTADLRTRAFPVHVTVDNAERSLLPGMIATVHIRQQVAEDELLVPQDWVVTRLDGLGVYVEEGGAARWRPVTLGRVVRNQVVVREGVSPGDRVITVGHRELVDGDAVLVAREGACCTDGRVTY